MRPALALLALLSACSAAEAPLRVRDAWLRALPEGTPTTAAYMTIENGSNAPVTITRVSSPAFARAELHETRIEQGIARMRPVPALEIVPNGRAVLAPGGLHLMLLEPVRALGARERVSIRLHLSDGAIVAVDAEVRAP